MNEVLNNIMAIIELYNSGAYLTKDKLIQMQRSLSSNIYFLTRYNIEAFNEWNKIVYNNKGSNASAQVEANQLVPELRMTRKILEAAKGVSICMNNELSIIKNEQ